jgi:hypothetical protein
LKDIAQQLNQGTKDFVKVVPFAPYLLENNESIYGKKTLKQHFAHLVESIQRRVQQPALIRQRLCIFALFLGRQSAHRCEQLLAGNKTVLMQHLLAMVNTTLVFFFFNSPLSFLTFGF